eukprot:TRINITY_DN16105_c0_g1_i1.p1 TRINITY_DN16105_c0_g1~~TRINITY_DN16105_c0_g1_i1.p1  ORF type:complete len:103 (-),score=17.41 TRINITY_DN16105_c0_g1_i1:110-418(-)
MTKHSTFFTRTHHHHQSVTHVMHGGCSDIYCLGEAGGTPDEGAVDDSSNSLLSKIGESSTSFGAPATTGFGDFFFFLAVAAFVASCCCCSISTSWVLSLIHI